MLNRMHTAIYGWLLGSCCCLVTKFAHRQTGLRSQESGGQLLLAVLCVL